MGTPPACSLKFVIGRIAILDAGTGLRKLGNDLLAQSIEQYDNKKGLGHSSCEQTVAVAEQARVKRLALFHHDPDHDDAFPLCHERECRQRFPNSFFAREGMEISL